MNTEELRKLLKNNGVVAYSYWGKNKLIDLAKIKLIIYYQNQNQNQKNQKNLNNQKI